MSDIQQALKETYDALQHATRVDRHLAELNQELSEAYQELDKLEKKLEKEFKDIERLEKLSVKGLFHQVLGSKEEQIEKERQEYLQASLKYDEAKKSAKLLEYERDLLEKKVQDLPTLKNQLDQLIKRREKDLIQNRTDTGKQLLEILTRIDTLHQFANNVVAVKKSGQEVLVILDRMLGHLRKAKNWGQWDMAGGRQRGASYMKHSAIDKARDLSYHVKHLLVRFQKDLSHIYGPEEFDLHIHLESFSRFTDIFFDNLISDWIIQQKIQNALSNVQSVRDRVARIMQSLDAEIQKSDQSIGALEEQRRQLVLKS